MTLPQRPLGTSGLRITTVGWLGAARLTLSDADLEQMGRAVERMGAGRGPSRPGPRPA